MKAYPKSRSRSKKAESADVSIAYDYEADVASISFGQPVKGEAEEIASGIYARYEWGTGRLAEICIVGFAKKFGKRARAMVVPQYAES